jgi:hypothetical protein
MSKQQTAVEWYAGKVHDLEVAKDFGAISVTEYYEELTKAVQQAKEMEREQIEQAFEIGSDSYYDLRQPSSCIQYYNETYGDNK